MLTCPLLGSSEGIKARLQSKKMPLPRAAAPFPWSEAPPAPPTTLFNAVVAKKAAAILVRRRSLRDRSRAKVANFIIPVEPRNRKTPHVARAAGSFFLLKCEYFRCGPQRQIDLLTGDFGCSWHAMTSPSATALHAPTSTRSLGRPSPASDGAIPLWVSPSGGIFQRMPRDYFRHTEAQ